MPADTAFDDDYVINLLLKDAEANKKQSSFDSLLSRKPHRPDAPKPNTRFLKNIIRETDSHNAALKAKEEHESKARLRQLKRSREDDQRDSASKHRRRGEREGRWASALAGLGRQEPHGERAKSERRPRFERAEEREKAEHTTQRQERRTREDKMHRSSHRDRGSSSDKLHPDRSHSYSRHRRHREQARLGESKSSGSQHHHSDRRRKETREDRVDAPSDSDPLEDIVGPQPPSRLNARGRNAHKSSGIDDRFSANYDPKTDVDRSDDDGVRDDWDMALEALRDRSKWRAQGGDRLRAAGFTDEEVRKWEHGSLEKGVDDVRWRKLGDGPREWDRGKVEEGDGVKLKPEWAR